MSDKHNENDVRALLAQAEQIDDLEQLRTIREKLNEISAWAAASFVAGKIARLERRYAEEVWR